MKKIHIALSVSDIDASVDEYNNRFGCEPAVVVPGEYALWRTECVNFSIRRVDDTDEKLRHFGWEDARATDFTKEVDCNGILWERFAASHQAEEINALWPESGYKAS